MKTEVKAIITAVIFLSMQQIQAQTNTFPSTGNAGIGTLSPATELQVIGTSRFGSTANYGQFDGSGNLKFNGSAAYKVKGNKYAFQYDLIPNYGLFFNSTDTLYEFRNSAANPAFKIGADNGNGIFKGGVSVGGNNTPPDKGLYVSGKLGIGISSPDAKLHITGGTEVTLSNGGTIVTGPITASNLAIDNDEIQSRNNGIASNLKINEDGGNVNMGGGGLVLKSPSNFVGIGTAEPAVKLNVVGGTDATLSGGGYIVAGPTTGNNLAIDDNEIMARNNGAASTLYLNNNGGDLNMSGGDLIISGTTGNVGIQTPPLNSLTLKIGTTEGAIIGIGDAETLEDFDNFTIGTNSDFITVLDDLGSLGTSLRRWRQLWAIDGTINTSDERDKTNIKDLNYGLKEIMQLHSVRFNWKDKIEKGEKLGLIAQQLQKVLPEVVRDYEYKRSEATGKTEKVPAARLGVMYADIIPVLINGMQQQQQMIEEQNKKIEALTQLVGGLTTKNTVNNNYQTENKVKTNDVVPAALLQQNAPNPFNSNTVIHYTVPSNAVQASLIITGTGGQVIKTIFLSKGAGQTTISANQLSPGNYFYTLIVDGKKMDTKQMVLTK